VKAGPLDGIVRQFKDHLGRAGESIMMRKLTMFGSVRRFDLLVALFVIGSAISSAPCVSADDAPRVVVLGEVQGAYESAVKTLLAVELIDDRLRWSGGDAILIQTGDLIDDGIRVRDVMDLFMRLQEEAEAAGGQVIVLLGNHEALNILGMRRSVNYETYQTFADEESAARQAEAYETHVRWQNDRAKALKSDPVEFGEQDRADWFAVHPPGYVEYVEAMGSNGRYGSWLRTLPAVVAIDGRLFIHGGISPALKGQDVDAINRKVAEEIELFSGYYSVMLEQGLISRLATAEDMSRVIGNEINFINAQSPKKLDKKRVELVTGLQDFGHQWVKWYLVRQDGPLWFKGATEWDEAENGVEMAEILDACGVSAMITGQSTGGPPKIEARFDGRVLLTSVGMSDDPWAKRQPACLEITEDDFNVVSPRGRQVLLLTSVGVPE
jgi:3',5'-cyclic AMP phosphodiesterase CpdA